MRKSKAAKSRLYNQGSIERIRKDERIDSFSKSLKTALVQNIAVVGLLYLISMASSAIIIHKVKAHIAENFLNLVRDPILLGDMRFVVQEANALTTNASSFDRIRFFDHASKLLFEANAAEYVGSIFKIEFSKEVYFDGAKSSSAGRIEFEYSIKFLLQFALISLTVVIAVTIMLNLHTRRRLLRQHQKEVADLRNAAIAEMIQMLSHDLRAPLGIFEKLLYIEPSKFLDMRDSIREALNRLTSMIDSLRYSEVEFPIDRKLANLDLAFGVESLRWKATKRSIKIVLPDVKIDNVWVDLEKFDRAWINLLSNAIDAARSEVAVLVKRHESTLILCVIDDGAGVSKELVPRLFEKGATFGKKSGTGLGLAYVKHVINGHSGDVSYLREDDKTIFKCIIPLAFSPNIEKTLDEPVQLRSEMASKNSKIIGISIRPRDLSNKVLDALIAQGHEDLEFEYGISNRCELVVTNQLDVALSCLEKSIAVLEFEEGASEDEIIDRAKRRMSIMSRQLLGEKRGE